MIDTNNLLTAGEVAKKLKVTVQSVRLLIKNGMLNAERVGNQWLTSIEDLNEYIEKNEGCLINSNKIKENLKNVK